MNNSVNIIFDYKSQLKKTCEDIKNNLIKVSKTKGLTESFKTQLLEQADVFTSLARDASNLFDNLDGKKLDVKAFTDFKKQVEDKFSEVDGQINNLTKDLLDLTGKVELLNASSVSKIKTEFDELKDSIIETNEGALKMIQNLQQAATGFEIRFGNKEETISGYETLYEYAKKIYNETVKISNLDDNLINFDLEKIVKRNGGVQLKKEFEQIKELAYDTSDLLMKISDLSEKSDRTIFEDIELERYLATLYKNRETINEALNEWYRNVVDNELIDKFPENFRENMKNVIKVITDVRNDIDKDIEGIFENIKGFDYYLGKVEDPSDLAHIDEIKKRLYDQLKELGRELSIIYGDNKYEVVVEGQEIKYDLSLSHTNSELWTELHKSLIYLQKKASAYPIITPIIMTVFSSDAESLTNFYKNMTQTHANKLQKEWIDDSETIKKLIHTDLEKIEDAAREASFSGAVKKSQQILEDINDYYKKNPVIAHLDFDKDAFIEASKKIISGEANFDLSEQIKNAQILSRELYDQIKVLDDKLKEIDGKHIFTGLTDEFKTLMKETYNLDSVSKSLERIEKVLFFEAQKVISGSHSDMWKEVQRQFNQISDKEGKINLNKQRKEIERLLLTYNEYLKLGGNKSFIDLTKNVQTFEKLKKRFNDLKSKNNGAFFEEEPEFLNLKTLKLLKDSLTELQNSIVRSLKLITSQYELMSQKIDFSKLNQSILNVDNFEDNMKRYSEAVEKIGSSMAAVSTVFATFFEKYIKEQTKSMQEASAKNVESISKINKVLIELLENINKLKNIQITIDGKVKINGKDLSDEPIKLEDGKVEDNTHNKSTKNNSTKAQGRGRKPKSFKELDSIEGSIDDLINKKKEFDNIIDTLSIINSSTVDGKASGKKDMLSVLEQIKLKQQEISELDEKEIDLIKTKEAEIISLQAKLSGMYQSYSAIGGTDKYLGKSLLSGINESDTSLEKYKEYANNVQSVFVQMYKTVVDSLSSITKIDSKTLRSVFDQFISSDNNATGIINTFKTEMYKNGKFTTEGFSKGINDGQSEVEAASEEMAKNPEKVTKKTLKIMSPSRVMKELGFWIVAGLDEGIKGNVYKVNDTLYKWCDDIVSDAKKISQSVMDALISGELSEKDIESVLNFAKHKQRDDKYFASIYKSIKDSQTSNYTFKSDDDGQMYFGINPPPIIEKKDDDSKKNNETYQIPGQLSLFFDSTGNTRVTKTFNRKRENNRKNNWRKNNQKPKRKPVIPNITFEELEIEKARNKLLETFYKDGEKIKRSDMASYIKSNTEEVKSAIEEYMGVLEQYGRSKTPEEIFKDIYGRRYKTPYKAYSYAIGENEKFKNPSLDRLYTEKDGQIAFAKGLDKVAESTKEVSNQLSALGNQVDETDKKMKDTSISGQLSFDSYLEQKNKPKDNQDENSNVEQDNNTDSKKSVINKYGYFDELEDAKEEIRKRANYIASLYKILNQTDFTSDNKYSATFKTNNSQYEFVNWNVREVRDDKGTFLGYDIDELSRFYTDYKDLTKNIIDIDNKIFKAEQERAEKTSKLGNYDSTHDDAELERLREIQKSLLETLEIYKKCDDYLLQEQAYQVENDRAENMTRLMNERNIKFAENILSKNNSELMAFRSLSDNSVTSLANNDAFIKINEDFEKGIINIVQYKKELNSLINVYKSFDKSGKYLANVQSDAQFEDRSRFNASLNGKIIEEGPVKELKNGLKQFDIKIRETDGSIKNLRYTYCDGMMAMADATTKSEKQLRGFASAANALKQKWKDVLSRVASYYFDVNDIMMYAREGMNSFKEFDDALIKISYTMDTSSSKMENLGNSILNLSNELKTSITNASSVAQIYANMNTTPEEVMDLSRPTLILSNLTGVSAEEAANQIQAVNQQFEIAEEESMHIADVYDHISRNIAVDYSKGIKGMAEAVEVAGSTAKQAGLSYEQLSAIIATTMESTRQEGSQIGNGLKTILTRLSKVGELSEEIDPETLSKASESLNEIGISVYDAQGNYQQFPVIMEQLAKEWDGLTDAQRSNISYNIAATRQTNLMSAILKNWTDSMELATSAMEAQGSAEENNLKYLDSVGGKIQGAQTALETFWTKFFDEDSIFKVIDAFTVLLQLVTQITDFTGGLNLIAGGIGTKLLHDAGLDRLICYSRKITYIANFVIIIGSDKPYCYG